MSAKSKNAKKIKKVLKKLLTMGNYYAILTKLSQKSGGKTVLEN